MSPSITPTASFTPLRAPASLTVGSILALRIGPLVTPGVRPAFLDEFMPPPPGTPWRATLLQSVALSWGSPSCLVPATPYVSTGHGALTVSLDGASVSVACVSADGELVMGTLTRAGSLALSRRCSGGASDPVFCSTAAVALVAAGGAAEAALTTVIAGLPAWADVPLASADARAAAVAPDGAVIYTTPSGVFRLAPDATGPSLLVEGSFNSSRTLQPGLLHVSQAGDVFLVGRPPAAWQSGGACGGGKAGVYHFVRNPAMDVSAPWACAGGFPRRGRTFLRFGRALSGEAVGDDYRLYLSTDTQIFACLIPSLGASLGAITCSDVASVADTGLMGARFAFRGVAVLPASV